MAQTQLSLFGDSIKPKKKYRPSKENQIILDSAIKIINATKTRMTVRQIYYRLVAIQMITNNTKSYNGLKRLLGIARKNELISWDSIEDRTRSFTNFFDQDIFTINNALDAVKKFVVNYALKLPAASYQEDLIIIGLEKQTLQSFFEAIIPKEWNVILVVGRGYNSLSQLYDLSEEIKNVKQIKRVHGRYFGDYDPSGEDIERNLKETLEEFGITFTTWKRCCLTQEQITQLDLPSAPPKAKDSKATKWIAAGKNSCVELDALPPETLEEAILNACKEKWNQTIANSVNHFNERVKHTSNKRFIELVKKQLIKIH